MRKRILFAATLVAVIPATGWSYDSAFTLDFEQATDAEGFTDSINNNLAVFSGENTPVDSPAYATPPNTAAGYNNSKWLRTGADVQPNGVATFAYDGRAGGSTDTALDFVSTVDVYVNPTASSRFQVALFGRWTTALANLPFEIFYSKNTPSAADGFGWRYGGSTTTYNAFTTATQTAPAWVRLKLQMKADQAIVSLDQDLDGIYEQVSPAITVTAVAPGKIGLQSIINNPADGSRIPDQFAYWDNLTFTPLATVSNWSLY